jgi:hypothetical protein
MPAGVAPIPTGELKIINSDPHRQKEKGLIHVSTPRGEVMWVHPDIVQDQQWTTANRKKPRGRGKAPCNMVGFSSKESEENVTALTDSEEEKTIFLAGPEIHPVSTTRSGKSYLKKYDEAELSAPKPIQEAANPTHK